MHFSYIICYVEKKLEGSFAEGGGGGGGGLGGGGGGGRGRGVGGGGGEISGGAMYEKKNNKTNPSIDPRAIYRILRYPYPTLTGQNGIPLRVTAGSRRFDSEKCH